MIFALSNSMGSFEIVLGFSWWWLLVCVLLAFGLTYLLYGKNPFEAEKKALWRLLFALRFSALTLLFFLLLKLLLKSNTKEIEKPIVLLALDQSQSIVQSNDSSFIKNDFLKQWEELANKLNDFEVRFLSFGEKVREEDAHPFNDKASNLSDLLQTTQLRYENRNVAALVMASDGLYNQGISLPPKPPLMIETAEYQLQSPFHSKVPLILLHLQLPNVPFLKAEYAIREGQ
jgi:hypothetical protein